MLSSFRGSHCRTAWKGAFSNCRLARDGTKNEAGRNRSREKRRGEKEQQDKERIKKKGKGKKKMHRRNNRKQRNARTFLERAWRNPLFEAWLLCVLSIWRVCYCCRRWTTLCNGDEGKLVTECHKSGCLFARRRKSSKLWGCVVPSLKNKKIERGFLLGNILPDDSFEI